MKYYLAILVGSLGTFLAQFIYNWYRSRGKTGLHRYEENRRPIITIDILKETDDPDSFYFTAKDNDIA